MRKSVFPLLTLLIFFFTGCSSAERSGNLGDFCGGATGNARVAGLAWLAGSPTQANGLCSIDSDGKASLSFSLDPESRDPLLFRDNATSVQILVERFAGRQARPSRITWFSGTSEKLGQRGDWPRNVYGINLLSASEAVVTGFDYAEIQIVNWQSNVFASPAALVSPVSQEVVIHPIQTLFSNDWFAAIDNGYDLVQYAAKESRAFVVDKIKQRQPPVMDVVIADKLTGGVCLNAFQSLSVSPSSVLLSCNPQYFGAAAGNRVSLFLVELNSEGQISSRELVHFDGDEIQRIDLWGLDETSGKVFLGYKKTAINDFEGVVVQSGWLDLRTGSWLPEARFAGPLQHLANGNGTVVFCQADATHCSKSQFAFIGGSSPTTDASSVIRLELNPSLPFLSFAHELRSK